MPHNIRFLGHDSLVYFCFDSGDFGFSSQRNGVSVVSLRTIFASVHTIRLISPYIGSLAGIVSWWKRSNEIGHSSGHEIVSVKHESRIVGVIDGSDHKRSSDSTPLPLDYPENDVERLEGLEEIDSNPNPFSDEYQARNSDLSPPPERDVVEEISRSTVETGAYGSSSITEPANPFRSSLDPRPGPTLAEEYPDSLVLRGSFLSEVISDFTDIPRSGLENDRSGSAVEVWESPIPRDENEGWTGTVLMRHDTLESNATYATLPSYRSRVSAGDLLESEPPRIPPLPSFRPLHSCRPLPSSSSPESDVGISRQISASTTRSYETVPSYRSS
ncbi:hypothetical protein BT96DRAFT_936928 [Gymnopus androsaceus JB14]|uniref:Uncharacterized protein n=1 Tax=Gymnopus androsaceus JB14 TaxID=1447944 RepID=A0A6A4I0A9_9AGAR|nr:hypothetical protein BT96DRAFT_936928 [Gymnopus androsaceus JB14]